MATGSRGSTPGPKRTQALTIAVVLATPRRIADRVRPFMV
jgi:hypothetical protein